MSRSARGPGALELIDSAFFTLRVLPATAWLWWASGALPFALSVVAFLTEMSSSAVAEQVIAQRSLLVAILFLWLGCAQTMFAVHVRTHLQGDDKPGARLRTVLLSTALIQASSLVVLPLGMLSIVGGPSIFAFYQCAAAYPFTREKASTYAVFRYGLREAVRWPKASAIVLSLLILLGGVVFVNIFAVIFAAPFLLRMLTGQETAFTRSPIAMLNGTTLLCALAISWLALDPLVKTVYVRRCFAADSLKTGTDLKAKLRTLVEVSLAGAALLCFASPLAAQAVAPKELDRAIHEVSQRPEYLWHSPRTAPAMGGNVFVRFTEDAIESIGNVIRSAMRLGTRAVKRLVNWIMGDQQGMPNVPSEGAVPEIIGPFLLLAILAIGGLAAFLILRARNRSGLSPAVPGLPAAPVDLRSEEVSPNELEGDEWLAMADSWAAEGDLRMAARAIFLSLLASLGRRNVISIHRAKSNLDYSRELARRTRGNEGLHTAFRSTIVQFERTWYGGHPLTRDRFDEYRASALNARSLAEQS